MAKEGTITFVASIPCTRNGSVYGYRILQCDNGSLSTVEHCMDRLERDVDVSSEMFCYLKPKGRCLVPSNLNQTGSDASDYMIIAKSTGFLEIIQDFKCKIKNKITLEPKFVLKCIPEDFISDLRTNYSVVSLEYTDGFLYCCMASGRIYVFILNLPEDYIQVRNEDICCYENTVDLSSQSIPTMNEELLNTTTLYCGDKIWKHICYFLIPVEKDYLKNSPVKTSITSMYGNQLVYRPSIFVQLDAKITLCHINPYDKYSLIIASATYSLIVRKLIVPSRYSSFMESFINLKDRVQDNCNTEIRSWTKFSKDHGHNSLTSLVSSDHEEAIGSATSVTWDDLARRDGTGILRTSVVWREKFKIKDDRKPKVHPISELRETLRTLPMRRRLRRRETEFFETIFVDGRYYITRRPNPSQEEQIDFTTPRTDIEANTSRFHRFSSIVDFRVSHKLDSPDCIPTNSPLNEIHNSFLTENYNYLNIVYIGKGKIFNMFKPKLQDEPIRSLESFKYFTGDNETMEEFDSERFKAGMILDNFMSFKKIFVITERLHLILDVCGVLLIDGFGLKDQDNLLNNSDSVLKVTLFRMGMISDAIIVVDNYEKCRNCNLNGACNDFNMTYTLIVGSADGSILALRGNFKPHSKLGELELRDSLRVTEKERYIDKLSLISSIDEVNFRKRPLTDESIDYTCHKRPK